MILRNLIFSKIFFSFKSAIYLRKLKKLMAFYSQFISINSTNNLSQQKRLTSSNHHLNRPLSIRHHSPKWLEVGFVEASLEAKKIAVIYWARSGGDQSIN